MHPKWASIFQAIMQTEQAVLPVFIHNPSSQKIVGAVVLAEEIFGQAFGLAQPPATAAPQPK